MKESFVTIFFSYASSMDSLVGVLYICSLLPRSDRFTISVLIEAKERSRRNRYPWLQTSILLPQLCIHPVWYISYSFSLLLTSLKDENGERRKRERGSQSSIHFHFYFLSLSPIPYSLDITSMKVTKYGLEKFMYTQRKSGVDVCGVRVDKLYCYCWLHNFDLHATKSIFWALNNFSC